MNIDKYVKNQEKSYELLISYLSNEDKTEKEENTVLNDILNQYDNILKGKEELRSFIRMISRISSNHHRYADFIDKIEQILLHYSSQIKENFTNQEIFKIFKNNKRILLFFFDNKIIIPNKSIVQFMKEKKRRNFHFIVYFLPEIKSFIHKQEAKMISRELSKQNIKESSIFNEKRKKGENDNYLCEIIRKDLIDEFIIFINQKNLSLNETKIKASPFETNSLLIKNEPSLIEYAAFYGSVQIFQYLKLNNAEMTSSLWKYAIHSNNAEIIYFLEENQVEIPSENYELCLKEAIKCHHNDIANYIVMNLMNEEQKNYNFGNNFDVNLFAYSFRYRNYCFFPESLKYKFIFYYLCKYDYYTLVSLFLKEGNIDINSAIKISFIKKFNTI